MTRKKLKFVNYIDRKGYYVIKYIVLTILNQNLK